MFEKIEAFLDKEVEGIPVWVLALVGVALFAVVMAVFG